MGVFKKPFSNNLKIISLVTMNIILIPLESLKRNIIQISECNILVVRFLEQCKEIEGRRIDKSQIFQQTGLLIGTHSEGQPLSYLGG